MTQQKRQPSRTRTETNERLLAAARIMFECLEHTPRKDKNGWDFAVASSAPDWVRNAIDEAHGQILPDEDYVLASCVNLVREILGVLDSRPEANFEFLNAAKLQLIEDHVYVSRDPRELHWWLASDFGRVAYCERAQAALIAAGQSPESELVRQMCGGQRFELYEIFCVLLTALDAKVREDIAQELEPF